MVMKCTYCQETNDGVRTEHRVTSYATATEVTVSGVIVRVESKNVPHKGRVEPTPLCKRCASDVAMQALTGTF